MSRVMYVSCAALALLAIGLGACARATPTLPPPPAVPSATLSAPGTVNATGNVVPAQLSHMGFVITARVAEVKVHEGEAVQPGQPLIVLDTPELSLAVTAAQAALRSAQANVDRLNYPYTKLFNFRTRQTVYVKEYPERRQAAQADLDAAQASLAAAQAALAQGTLLAPYAGTVVTLPVRAGELVQAGEVVAVIGTLDHLQVETKDLSERDISQVKLGQAAVVRLKALDQSLNGKVTAIAPIAAAYNGGWVYQVTIQLDEASANARWGMSADITIQTP